MSQKPVAVFTGPDHSAAVARNLLGDFFHVVAVRPEPDDLLPALHEARVFIDASMRVPLGAGDIAAAQHLELVITATTGATHIDQKALAERDIPLMTLKGQTEFLRGITPAAELSWALVMACARHLRAALGHVTDGGWERTRFPGLMLKGRTIGLIGMGRIGGWMARYADAFGMSVVYHDPHVGDAPDHATAMPLKELVALADIISIHVHVDDETRGMVDAGLLGHCKPGAIFINTARSELSDENALVAALENGRLSAVGVDVLAGEPDPEASPLWQYAQNHDNVVITPHIGGFCPDAVDHVVAFTCGRILKHFNLHSRA
jgi:D-3-phosphoglycerate dehydrogenase